VQKRKCEAVRSAILASDSLASCFVSPHTLPPF